MTLGGAGCGSNGEPAQGGGRGGQGPASGAAAGTRADSQPTAGIGAGGDAASAGAADGGADVGGHANTEGGAGATAEGGTGGRGHGNSGEPGSTDSAGASGSSVVGDSAGGEAGSSSGASSGGAAGGEDQVPSGFYDSKAVYLWGTLAEGLCFRDAVAPVLSPNRAATGFSCDTPDGSAMPIYGSVIHPTRHHLLFIVEQNQSQPGKLLSFVPDGNGMGDYPTHPHANDQVIPIVCDADHGYYVTGVFVTPDSGDVIYGCSNFGCGSGGCRYFSETGTEYPVPAGASLVDLGYGGTALFALNGGLVFRNASGDLFPLEGDRKQAVRAWPGGFWVARAAASGASPERWSVTLDGTYSRDGQYPEPPVSSVYAWPMSSGDFSSCKFDGGGALLCFGKSALDSSVDQILSADLTQNRAVVVYTEATAPLVRVHGSYLVTGP